MQKDMSQLFVSDNVSAASVDLATHFIVDEFHAIGCDQFLLSVINLIWPPWFPSFRRLLKLACV